MIYYEVVVDGGDGSYNVARLRTEEEAEKYCEQNDGWCHEGYSEVDTDSPYFFDEVEED
jgi:hypothetical protein